MKKILFVLLFSFGSLFAFDHLTINDIDEKLKGKNAIVDFYADWCPPCKILGSNLIKFDKTKPENVTIYKVDIEDQKELARNYGIRSLPTLVYIKDGKIVAKEVGIKNINRLKSNVKTYF